MFIRNHCSKEHTKMKNFAVSMPILALVWPKHILIYPFQDLQQQFKHFTGYSLKLQPFFTFWLRDTIFIEKQVSKKTKTNFIILFQYIMKELFDLKLRHLLRFLINPLCFHLSRLYGKGVLKFEHTCSHIREAYQGFYYLKGFFFIFPLSCVPRTWLLFTVSRTLQSKNIFKN